MWHHCLESGENLGVRALRLVSSVWKARLIELLFLLIDCTFIWKMFNNCLKCLQSANHPPSLRARAAGKDIKKNNNLSLKKKRKTNQRSEYLKRGGTPCDYLPKKYILFIQLVFDWIYSWLLLPWFLIAPNASWLATIIAQITAQQIIK